MSALSQASAKDAAANAMLAAARPYFVAAIWAWVADHESDVIFSKKLWGLFTVTITVGEVAHLIEAIAGPRPS